MRARARYLASTSMTLAYTLLRDAIAKVSWPEIRAVGGALVEFAGGRRRVRRAGRHPWPM